MLPDRFTTPAPEKTWHHLKSTKDTQIHQKQTKKSTSKGPLLHCKKTSALHQRMIWRFKKTLIKQFDGQKLDSEMEIEPNVECKWKKGVANA